MEKQSHVQPAGIPWWLVAVGFVLAIVGVCAMFLAPLPAGAQRWFQPTLGAGHVLFLTLLWMITWESVGLWSWAARLKGTNPESGEEWLATELTQSRQSTIEVGRWTNPAELANVGCENIDRRGEAYGRRWLILAGISFVVSAVGYVVYSSQLAVRIPQAAAEGAELYSELAPIVWGALGESMVILGLAS